MKKSYDFSKAERGPVIGSPAGKTRITIPIDDDVLEWFREQAHEAGGASYQAMINRALHEYIDREQEPLEETLRRVLSEVLPGPKTKTRSRTAKKPPRKNPGRR